MAIPESYATSPVNAAVERLWAKGVTVVASAGNLGDAQEFPTVLDAAETLQAQAPHVRWIIVGDGRMGLMPRVTLARQALTATAGFPPIFVASARALAINRPAGTTSLIRPIRAASGVQSEPSCKASPSERP